MEERSVMNGTELTEPENPKKRRKRGTKTIVAWPVKFAVSFFLVLVSLFIGLMIGYSGIGHAPIKEVFEWSTYKHIYDLVFKVT